MTGTLVLTAAAGNFNLGWLSGTLLRAYVYDTTTNGEPLVAYADNLNIDWTDLSSFMDGSAGYGPAPVMLVHGQKSQGYEFDRPNTRGITTVDLTLHSAAFSLMQLRY